MSHPSNWIEVRFEEIVQNITDRIDKPSESGLDYYVGLEHLDTDCIRIKKYGSPEQVNATKYLSKKGDLIFGKRRAYLRKVAITQHPAVVSAHSMILRPKGKLIHPDFLPCFLQSSTFWKIALSISEGSLSPTIKWKTLAKQHFMIPPLEEQKRIAGLLWSIEENIEKNELLIAINEKIKMGMLDYLIFDNSNCVSVNLGNKNYFKVLGSGVNKFKESKNYLSTSSIEDHQIKYIEEEITLDKRPSRANMQPVNDSVWFARMKLTNKFYYFVNNNSEIDRYILSTGFAGIFCERKTVLPEYLFQIISSAHFQKEKDEHCQGGVQPAINNTSIKKITIPVPKIASQKIIVNRLSGIDEFKSKLINNLMGLKSLKKKLTDEIMKGEVKL